MRAFLSLLALAALLVSTREAHAAAFPYITLNSHTNRVSDNGTNLTYNGSAVGGGGSAPAGTMVNSGTPAVGAVPSYSNATGTNLAPSTATITNGAIYATGNNFTNGAFIARAANGAAFEVLAPSGIGTGGNFRLVGRNYPNGDGSPNDTYGLIFNRLDNGSAENPYHGSWSHGVETSYSPTGASNVSSQMETYYGVTGTNGTSYRPWGFVFVDRTTNTSGVNSITGNSQMDSFTFGGKENNNDFLVLAANSGAASGGQIRLYNASQVLHNSNNVQWLQQVDTNAFSRSIAYINSSNWLVHGDSTMPNYFDQDLRWKRTNVANIGTADYTASPLDIFPQRDLIAGRNVTAGGNVTVGGTLALPSDLSTTNITGDLRIRGATNVYNGTSARLVRVDNSTGARTFTIAGDGRVFIGSDNGNDYTLSVDMSGAHSSGNLARFADSSGTVTIAGQSLQTSAATFNIGANGFGNAFVFNTPAANNLVTIGGTTLTLATDLVVPKTIIAAGTTGTQTINKTTGRVNFVAGAQTLVVTNSLATANSIVLATVATDDATALSCKAIPAAGQITLKLNATATAETAVAWLLTN